MADLLGTKFGSTSRLKLPAQVHSSGAPLDNQDTLLQARRRDAALRNLLLGGVAAGIAMFGYGRTAYAACATVGTTMTCTGDLSAGVATTNPITVLNVNSLTTDITPAATVDGINFTSDGAITIVSDTGDFEIIATGANAEGIHAFTTGAAAVSVTHTGDITSDDNQGIYARSNGGTVTTVSTGDIQADDDGIFAYASGVGADAVSVTHTGDITSDNNRGINARSFGDAITTVSTGTIQAKNEGILAETNVAAAVSVTHTGDITSTSTQGIYATSLGGTVTTVSTGDIQAASQGISARTSGAAAVSVTHTGDITSTSGQGIRAYSFGGAITTVSTGDIQAGNHGIYAYENGAAGAVSVTHTGDITSDTNRGIFVRSTGGGTITTVSTGTIQAENDGIHAFTNGASAVSVTHTGDIASTSDRGIYASSAGGSLAITLGEGVVQGPIDAIRADSATGTELTLNAGSVIIGSINITGAGAAVLNTGPGLSIAHTFTGTVPSIGDVSGNVAVVSGNQIAVADISGFVAADNQLSATLDGVSGVLAASQHRDAGNWWVSGFGGFGVTDAVDNSAETTHKYGGLVAGTFALLDNGVQLGIFAGAAKGAHTAEITNGLSGSSNSYFAGINGRFAAELFALDFAVTAGMSTNEGERIIANNTVATGLETALSSYDSYFIAPEITLSTAPITIQDFNFIPSLRVRYEAMQSGGFTETGVTAGSIIAGDAISHAANIRLQGAVPIDLNMPGTTLMARGGVDTRFASSSGNDITLMGVVTSDAGANDEFSARGFAGLDFTHALTDYAALTANGELRGGTTGFSASASLGLKGKF